MMLDSMAERCVCVEGDTWSCSSIAVYYMHHSLCVQTTDCLAPSGESQLALSAALLGLQCLKVDITIEY